MGLYGNGHQEYYNKDNIEVPSVTTILKILSKPALQRWANYLGFKRMDVKTVVDEKAHIGTNTHEAINAFFNKEKYIPDLKYPNELDKLKVNLNSFFKWYNNNDIEPIYCENKYTSDLFGGTIDFYGLVNDKLTLIDFKTSKDFYPSMFLQLGAYTTLLELEDIKVKQVGIVLVNGNMRCKTLCRKEIEPYRQAFNSLAETYHTIYKLDILSKQYGIKPIIDI